MTGQVTSEEDEAETTPFSIVQGDRCVPVTPLAGDDPVEAVYDWAPTSEKLWSSNGTVNLQRDDTSIAFLYEGPEATSLVFVHGKLDGDGDGGSVSFAISGLPSDGEWVVEDDEYDDPNNYDEWDHDDTSSEIDWTWSGGRTDGGVFRGMTDDATVRIVPRFNDRANLSGQYYEGTVQQWEFLSGAFDDPQRIELAMDDPLLVTGQRCGDDDSSGDGGDDGGDDDSTKGDDDDDDQRKGRTKHQRKQRKHEQKHQRKQRKHEQKHERKQRKHEKDRGDDDDDGDGRENGNGRGRDNGKGNGNGRGKGNGRGRGNGKGRGKGNGRGRGN